MVNKFFIISLGFKVIDLCDKAILIDKISEGEVRNMLLDMATRYKENNHGPDTEEL